MYLIQQRSRAVALSVLEHFVSPFRIATLALMDWWRDWVGMATVNLVWLLCCATILLGPPATFAIYHYMREVHRGRGTGPYELLSIGRRLFIKSWLWFLANFFVALLIWANLHFYTQLSSPFTIVIYLLLFTAVGLWLAVQFYVLPYFMIQEKASLRQAHRNALLTTLASPLYTLALLLISGLLLAVSTRLIFLIFLGAPCLIAMIATHAVTDRLRTFGIHKENDSAKDKLS